MRPIDAAIVETLRRTGPCRLDDVVTSLSIFSWGEIFDSVDRMSRDGRVLLAQLGYSTYQLSLVHQDSYEYNTYSNGADTRESSETANDRLMK